MKIAIAVHDLRIEEQPLDTSQLQPHEIWVETRISALKIGTDRGNYEGAERVPGAPDFPRWVGDSNLGQYARDRQRRCARAGGRPHHYTYAASIRLYHERKRKPGQGAAQCSGRRCRLRPSLRTQRALLSQGPF